MSNEEIPTVELKYHDKIGWYFNCAYCQTMSISNVLPEEFETCYHCGKTVKTKVAKEFAGGN